MGGGISRSVSDATARMLHIGSDTKIMQIAEATSQKIKNMGLLCAVYVVAIHAWTLGDCKCIIRSDLIMQLGREGI